MFCDSVTLQRCGCDMSARPNLWNCLGMANVKLAGDDSIMDISCSIHEVTCQKTVRNDQTVGEYLT